MVWARENRQGCEAFKIRWEMVKYTRGMGIDLGCGPQKVYPHFIGVDNNVDEHLFGIQCKPDVKIKTAEDLSLFGSQSLDFVFSSHLLEHIDYNKVPKALKEWWRLIKPNGYLVLYLPDEDEYPKVGEEGANPDHKWNVNYQRVVDAMGFASFDLVEYQKRNQDEEYSLYFVFKKIGSGNHFSYRKEKPNKTVGVVRYGAIGDLLQASSVFSGLKKQGYHVTLFTSPPGSDVVKFDPHIDDFYYQDKDQVPNHLLGEYWAYHKEKFDHWVNLSESVEGTFLALPGRAAHEWSPAVRHKYLNRNYLEFQHELAGVPHKPDMKFYSTLEEREWARKERAKMGEFVIVWALAGSSVHKTNPHLDACLASLMIDFKHVDVVTTGDQAGVLLEQGWENEPRVHKRAGKWSVRETLAFLEQTDMVVGPETGVLNAAANLPIPKIVFLSHSTEENLTRDWINTTSFISEKTSCPGRGNNEAPACHQLHYGWKHCKQTPNGLAQCQEDINGEEVYKSIWHTVTAALEQKHVRQA
jgi:predicted SAM-dependent methyltransferase